MSLFKRKQTQRPQQTQQLPARQTVQQTPVRRQQTTDPQAPVSAIEKALRGVEEWGTMPASTTDIEKLGPVQTHAKEEKLSPLYQSSGGLRGSRRIARLPKEARTHTRSDVQRLAVKERLLAIARDFSENPEVKRNKSFLKILKKIKEYSKTNVTGASEGKAVTKERKLYREICKDLTDYVHRGLAKNSDTLLGMSTRLHVFFMTQQMGNLDVPANARVIKDNLRPATLIATRQLSGNNEVYLEDESSRSRIEERDVSKQPLFPHEPSINDIRQGKLGDCFFLAALASILDHHPQEIKNCMRDDGDSVTVRFFKKDEHGSFVPVYVNAQKRIPVFKNEKGTPDIYAQGALWVQMMERAYAIARNQLTGLDRFGNSLSPEKNTREKLHRSVWIQWMEARHHPEKMHDFNNMLRTVRNNETYGFMFDINGEFIPDFRSIPTEPSFADIVGGKPAEVFEAVLGRQANTILLADTRNQWATRHAMDRLRRIYGPADNSIENTEEGNRKILRNAIINAMRAHPLMKDIQVDEHYLETTFDMESLVYRQTASDLASIAEQAQREQDAGRTADIAQIVARYFDTSATYGPVLATFQPADMQEKGNAQLLLCKILDDIRATILQGAETSYPQQNAGEAYGEDALAVYDYIRTSLEAGKVVSASSRVVKQSNQSGLNQEAVVGGIAAPHSYTVLGVEEVNVKMSDGDTRPCKFVRLRNPWGKTIARYDVEDGKMTHSENEAGKDKQGFFLIELHDFIQRFKSVHAA